MADTPLVAGIDIGTGGCKVVVFDLAGRQVASAFREYSVYHPRVGWAEQDPNDWWRAAVEALREVTRIVGSESIEAVGLSSQREAFAPLDKEGRVLYNAIIWLDSRASKQEEWVRERVGSQRVLEITGLPVDQMFSAVKLLWLMEEAEQLFRRIDRILFAKDFIAYKLTGEACTDFSMASRTMLLDIRKLKWSLELCEELGIPAEILPPLKGSWEVVGEVTSEAAEVTGLKRGTPIVSGGGDRPCEALGAGVVDEGEVNIGTGTGTCFEAPLVEPRPDKKMRIDTCVHVVPNRWEYEIVVNATGESLRWFRDQFGGLEVEEARRRQVSAYDVLLEEAGKVPPGSEGLFYYPYLWGAKAPFFNPRAKGVFIGFTHAHTRGYFVRAILEGVAFQYKGVLDLLEELGVHVKRLTMTGGEARGELWNRIKASVVGVSLLLPHVSDAAGLGAAILAAVGCGHYGDVRRAIASMVHIERAVDPDPEMQRIYAELYPRYLKTYRCLEQAFNSAKS
ncbi:MAG: xylulokinase [Thermofilaceae archaeon]